MHKLIFILVGILLGINTYGQTEKDQLLGKWNNPDKTRVIEFVKNGDSYEAIILKSDEASYVGKKQITGLKQSTDNTYNDGTVHILMKNKTANCSAKLLNAKELELIISIGFMTKSAVWTRVKNQ